MSLPYDVHDPPLMVCGHYANATMGALPACAIHTTTEVNPNPPAKPTGWYCCDCKRTSEKPVAFANAADGTHYDGCRGWN